MVKLNFQEKPEKASKQSGSLFLTPKKAHEITGNFIRSWKS